MITIDKSDRNDPVQPELTPVTIVLDRLRSAYNVGNIFRLADAVRAERIIACGYTACPPHPKLQKTARGCDAIVPSEHDVDSVTAVRRLQEQGYTVYAVETAEQACPPWEVHFKFPSAILLGNEALGVQFDALQQCDHIVRLPALGLKNSINVGNCAAVILYEVWRQWQCRQTQSIE